MYEELLARCTEEGPQSFATQAYTVDPRSFGSLTPKSSYWPDVEAAHRRYRVTVCSYSTGAEFKAFYIEHFLPDLSEADLRVAIAFTLLHPGSSSQPPAKNFRGRSILSRANRCSQPPRRQLQRFRKT